MGMLIEGRWSQARYTFDETGRFKRRPTTFRGQIEAGPDAPHPPAPGRYHLYVSLACPWAHRVLLVRALRGLTNALSVSVVHSYMGEDGWTFKPGPGVVPDPLHGAEYLRDVYTQADPHFTGNVTVPVLWDIEAGTIVNNESREIIRMLNTHCAALRGAAPVGPELAPPALHADIDAALDAIYEPINNGVYRAGFAQSQAAHAEAVTELFAALDHWEQVLGQQKWLCGDALTEADLCLFTTLIRFDSVYVTHFKCALRRVVDYPNLWAHTRAVYQLPGVAETVDLAYTKAHYFVSHTSINPRQLVPVGPDLALDAPHDRDRFDR